jgi:vancomycin resistance protein YoaR
MNNLEIFCFSHRESDVFEATLSDPVVDLKLKNGATAPDILEENNNTIDVEVFIKMDLSFIRTQKGNTL